MAHKLPRAHLFMGFILALIGFVTGAAWKAMDLTPSQHQAESVRQTVTPRPDLPPDEQATIQLFEQASPSVVFITSLTVQQDFFRRNVTEIPRGTGTGFIWDTAGHIVTNYHVIQDADRVHVTLADQTTWPAHLVGNGHHICTPG